MKITWLIGNGFDLRVGLKTRYSDFYNSAYVVHSKGNCIYENIKSDYRSWADFEAGLGKFSYRVDSGLKEHFIECMSSCNTDLKNYLHEQEQKYGDISKKKIEIFNKSLVNIHSRFSPAQKKIYMSQFGEKRTSIFRVKMSILSFNYTDVLKRYFDRFKDTNMNDGKTWRTMMPLNFYAVHGTIKDGIIWGCDSSDQYNHEMFKDVAYMFEKPVMNNLHNNVFQNAVDTIKASDIYCIYGMSIGETDKTWWSMIAEQLLRSYEKLLVIFLYIKDGDKIDIYEAVGKQETVKEIFLSRAGVSEEKQDAIKKRIIVSFYLNDIFDFSSC